MTGNVKKVKDRWYPEVYCSLCGSNKFVKPQSLKVMICCPTCRGLGTIEDRIKNRSIINEASGCMEWTSSTNADGYAIISIGKKKIRVAKYLLEKELGRAINDGFETCHTCNNRKCISIKHLYEGTHQQNQSDIAKNGSLRGKNAKISKDTALKIKQMINMGKRTKDIVSTLCVSETNISNIKQKICWAWLNTEE